MTCPPGNSLSSALRTCGACRPLPPGRNWVLADRVSESRATIGNTVQVRLDAVPTRDSRGRWAHVRGVYFEAVGTYTSEAMAAAVSAYDLRAWLDALVMEDVTSHQYWPTITGRTILDDQYFREYVLRQLPYLHFGVQGDLPNITDDLGVPANSTMSPVTTDVDISVYAPLVATRVDGGGNPLEGLIPLASLQRQGVDALRFRIRQSIPGVTAVTFDAISRPSPTLGGDIVAGMNVWLDLVYLPAIVLDAPWCLDEYTLPDQSGTLRHASEKTEYAWLRYFPEDDPDGQAAGQTAVQGLEGYTVQVDGMAIVNGLQSAEMTARMLRFVQSDRDSAITRDNAAQDLPLIDGGPLAMALLPMRGRESCAAGPVTYEYAQSPNSFYRYVQRSVGCHSAERARALQSALACDPCQVVGTDGRGQATPGKLMSYEPVIIVPMRSRLGR